MEIHRQLRSCKFESHLNWRFFVVILPPGLPEFITQVQLLVQILELGRGEEGEQKRGMKYISTWNFGDIMKRA